MGAGRLRLTKENQGYWDRIKRADSWVERARSLEAGRQAELADLTAVENHYHEQFIYYWIAFNAMCGRADTTSHAYLRRYLDDFNWFLARICELDRPEGKIEAAVRSVKREIHGLLKDRFLVQEYWREGYSTSVRRILENDRRAAEEALDSEHVRDCLEILFLGRLRILRNQIFHGCSTYRDSLNKDSLRPAVKVLSTLVPLFLEIMRERGSRNDWPPIPYPRKGSPQHPEGRDHD